MISDQLLKLWKIQTGHPLQLIVRLIPPRDHSYICTEYMASAWGMPCTNARSDFQQCPARLLPCTPSRTLRMGPLIGVLISRFSGSDGQTIRYNHPFLP